MKGIWAGKIGGILERSQRDTAAGGALYALRFLSLIVKTTLVNNDLLCSVEEFAFSAPASLPPYLEIFAVGGSNWS